MPNRVVITGMGLVSSLGRQPDIIFESIKTDKVCFKPFVKDCQTVVSPVETFDIKSYTGRFKNLRYLNPGVRFALASALTAMADAKIDKATWETAGVFAGSGPNLDIGEQFPQIKNGCLDSPTLNALWMLKFLPNTAASVISQLIGAHGENLTIGTACSASLQAIGEAFRKVKYGQLDLALAGGGDSRLSTGGILAYNKAQALAKGAQKASQTIRPFDMDRKGFVPGEGGAFFTLESLAHAQKRGAHIYAEIIGYSSSMDGHTMTSPRPDGKYASLAIQNAIKEADLVPQKIDCVSAHGTGTLLNDQVEADIISNIFRDHHPHVIALKSWVGHVSAACGAVELGLNLILMQNRFLPAIRNLDHPCRSDVKFVRENLWFTADRVLLENFGFGGQNAALVIQRWKP